MEEKHDTIAAIATALGQGGVSIIRISGERAKDFFLQLFVSPKAQFSLRPRYMHYGHLQHNGQILDEVLAVYMPGPHSVTGEDVVEFHCHGGSVIARSVLEAVLALGARLAKAGEFTRRSFLHGKIDLTQAEAIGELVSSMSTENTRFALAKLSGVFAQKISTVKSQLDSIRTHLLYSIDFPEEEHLFSMHDEMSCAVEDALGSIDSLLAAFDRAQLWREGACVVLVGCVNAGKSSLFNSLLGRKRALVSSEAGTTRDYLEELININGMPIRLIDTAGIRDGAGSVEQEGIAFSKELLHQANLLLVLVDARQKDISEELLFVKDVLNTIPCLFVVNKIDSISSPPAYLSALPTEFVSISAKEGMGLEELSALIQKKLLEQKSNSASASLESDLVPNLRQAQALQHAKEELQSFKDAVLCGYPAEIAGMHLDRVAALLDETIGLAPSEELLDSIFSSFCIGK